MADLLGPDGGLRKVLGKVDVPGKGDEQSKKKLAEHVFDSACRQ